MTGLQVLLEYPASAAVVAGVPTAIRTAHALVALSPSRVVLSGDGDPEPYAFQLRDLALSAAPAAAGIDGRFDANAPLLVLGASGFAEAEALGDFERRARSGTPSSRWLEDGRGVAAYFKRAGDARGRVLAQLLMDPSAETLKPAGRWWPAADAAQAAAAQAGLFARLPQETDGYIARLDRRVSMALSRRLIATPVTPNQITTISLVLGLIGSSMLAAGTYPVSVAGALILWGCCILDGCDGEVARLKLMASEAGGRYDVISDNIVHMAIFIALVITARRDLGPGEVLLPGGLLLSGVLLCMFSVWWLVLRHPKEKRGPGHLLVERVASRDFIYLVLMLAVLGKLEWFVWAAGVGSHLFNVFLWWRCRP